MDAKTYQLQEILKPERRYLIPTFQRDYEWTEEGQWRLLFEDLANTTDRLLSARETAGGASGIPENRVQPHFMGAVVLASLPYPTGGVAPRSVIDGQQRLTTVQLLCRGLLDVLLDNESERAKSVRRMLFNPDDVIESDAERYKVWPRRRDREVWPLAMGEERPDGSEHRDHLYVKARRYFREAAASYATDEDGIVSKARLAALADAFGALFKLVVIDLDDNDDAQVIFEVLNGRQTPLSAIDLVKNLLFLRAELQQVDVESLYDRYWAQFDDPWWKSTVGIGHATRGRRDVLLSIWLTAATGEEANVANLYRETREYLDRGPSPEVVLKNLNEFARGYREVYGAEPVEDDRLARSYATVRALEITTAMPLLVWLRTLRDAFPREEHVAAARAVESWAIRRMMLGRQTRGYGAHLARVLKKAQDAHTTGAPVLPMIVEELQRGSLGWPSDTELLEGFRYNRFYNWISQQRMRLVLGAIDKYLRENDPHEPAASVAYDSLQIEHVMPQKWLENWPILGEDGAPIVPSDDDPIWLKHQADRDAYVHRIGNLTLVTGNFNLDVSNRAWDEKRLEFMKQKSLVINYPIANSEAWGESQITERAERLAGVALQIWPSPDHLTS